MKKHKNTNRQLVVQNNPKTDGEATIPRKKSQRSKGRLMKASTVIDERTGERKLLVKFDHTFGERVTAAFDSALVNEPSNFVKSLLRQGADLPSLKKKQAKIIEDLLTRITRTDRILAVKPGFKIKSGFVLGPLCLGTAKETHVALLSYSQQQAGYIGARKGNVESWGKSVGAVCSQSSFAMFAACAALAAPLSQYVFDRIDGAAGINELTAETATFLFIGDSSSGKTGLGRIAMSTMGNKPLEDWNVTPRRLAELAEEHNNILMILDDAEKTDPDATTLRSMLHRVSQTIPAGKGKNVSENARKSGLPDLMYNTWGLASALDNADTPFEKNGWNPSAGALIRLVPIPLPAPSAGGIFDRLSWAGAEVSTTSEKLARELDYALQSDFGTLFPKWIKKLLARNRAAEIIRLRDKFVTDHVIDPEPWDTRIARKFGAVYAAGVLASKLKIVPWSEDDIRSSVSKCYGLAASYRANRLDGLKGLREEFLSMLSSKSKFARVEDGRAILNPGMLGVRGKYKGKRVLAVRNDELVAFCNGRSRARLVNVLAKDCILIRGKGRAGTIQLPIKLTVAKAQIEKPRFWLFSRAKVKALASVEAKKR